MSRNKPRNSSRPALRLPLIDIVVTTAGRFDELRKCLNTLHRDAQAAPFGIAVHVVDNGSDPEERLIESNAELFTKREETQYFTDFRTKRIAQNAGFPVGANTGAGMGSAPLIMFLSDDVELMPGTLEKIVRRMDDPTIGVVGIKLLFPPNSPDPSRPAGKVQHIGLALDIHGNPIHALVGWRADHPKCCVSRESFAVTGACFTIRRKLFAQAGGFNLAYGRGTFEDVDLCLTVRQLGSKIFMDADAPAYHYVGATAEKRKEPFPLGINSMIFKSRWANSGKLIWDEFTYW
jgi:GT2 family glycosyltransferase